MVKKKIYCHYCSAKLGTKVIDSRERLFCKSCNSIIYENPLPANAVVLVDDLGRILLVKRSVEPKKGCWCLPGGFMELGETPEGAALRELKEETGLDGKIDLLLGVQSNPSPTYHTVFLAGYLVREYSGEPKAGDDAEEIMFFNYDELPEIAFKSHAAFIRTYHAAYSGVK